MASGTPGIESPVFKASEITVHLPDNEGSPEQTPAERELAELLVSALNLEVDPHTIAPEEPLYGDGLGLDSIDILEVALEVSRKYGFELRSDDKDNVRIFTSLRTLASHIAANRTR